LKHCSKKIQDCVDFSEAGGVAIGAAQKLSSAYSKIFKSRKFKSACRRWDEKKADKTWNNFKFMLQLLTVSTDRFRGRKLEPKDLSMQKSPRQAKMTWQNKHWELLLVWQQQQLLSKVLYQNSQKTTPVWPRGSKTMQYP
jgi:hypothetical protein